MKSIIGGYPPDGYPPDGYPPRGLWVEDIAYDDDVVEESPSHGQDMEDAETGDAPLLDAVNDFGTDVPLDEQHEVQRQVMETFDRSDALHLEVGNGMDVADDDKVDGDTMDGLEDLYDKAITPVYVGSKTSVVSATIVLMNMCTVIYVSNRFVDELL